MWYKFLRFLQKLLPFGLVLAMYKSDPAIPAIITKGGVHLKAIMLTNEYGLLFTEQVYTKNRTKKLREKQQELDKMNKDFLDELNSLTYAEKEAYYQFKGNKEDNNGKV